MKDRFTRQSRTERGRVRPALRVEIFERDGFRCQYCSREFQRENLTIDHLVPLALGGVDEAVNYATACQPCNARKAAQPLAQFAASLGLPIESIGVTGDPIIDNLDLPLQIRLLRKRIFDSVRAGKINASGKTFQKRIEKAFRRAFWETPEGKALEATFPALPGHARIMIPEIQTIADNGRDYHLLIELAKSANTRNLIGATLTASTPVESVVRRLAMTSPDLALRKRLGQALERFERSLRQNSREVAET